MFVGGGVVNGLDGKRLHDGEQPLFVLHRTQKRQDFDAAAFFGQPFAQLFVNAVQRKFRQFEQQQFGGAAFQNLAAQFGTDGTARTRYHHDFAGDVRAHQFGAGGDGVAAEQVDDGDFFQRTDFDFPVHQVFHAGDGQHFAVVLFQVFDNGLAFFHCRAGNGEQDFFHAVAAD